MTVLGTLEGRPIYEGMTLYDREGTALIAHPTIHRDYQFNMYRADNHLKRWLTNTHWKAAQVLFWSLEDVPEKILTSVEARNAAKIRARSRLLRSARER